MSEEIEAQLNEPVPAGTFGGLFITRPQGNEGEMFDEDRDFIVSEGFTIIETVHFAGHAEITVFGQASAVAANFARIGNEDRFNRYSLPSYFFLLPEGEILTPALIKTWAPKDRVAFV